MLLCVRRLVAWLLRGQPLPRHVAFIMDGNRRFADQLGLQRIDGHRQGYAQMKQIIQWCLELGVSCVSVYAFSLDNYRRPAAEVDALMELAAAKFEELMNDPDAKSWGAELRVIGDLSRAPSSVQAMAAKLMRSSRDAGPARAVINICFSYTSSQELQAAVDAACCGMQHSQLLPHDVTPGLLQRLMHTQDCPPVDLLVRTSGEQRLSDFLLWQSAHALLHWEPCLWPQFGYASLLRALLAWQAAAPTLSALRTAADEALAEDDALQQQLGGGSGACSPPPCPWSGQATAALHWPEQQQQQQQQPDAVVELQQQLQQKLLQHEQQQELQQQQLSPFQQAQFQQQTSSQGPKKALWPLLGGLFSTTGGGWGMSGSSSGNSWSSLSPYHLQQQQQASQPPAGRSPDRSLSMSLSVISEDEAICCPHPSQQLRVAQFLARLGEQQARQLAAMAAM